MTKAGLQITVLSKKRKVCKLPVILLLSLMRTMLYFAHEGSKLLKIYIRHASNP